MKPGFDAILWLLIAGTASLIIWMLFTSLGSGAYPFPPPIPTIDPSPPPDISTPSTKPTTPDVHTPSTSSPSPDTHPPSTIKPPTSEFCTSKGCTKAASHLMSSIDPEINPCDDFYAFSCGGYIKNRPLPRGLDGVGRIRDFVQLTRNTMIEYLSGVPLNNESSIADKQVTRLFQLCLDADRHGMKPFISTIEKAGGLPFNGKARPEWEQLIGLLGGDSFPLFTSANYGSVWLETPQLLLPNYIQNLETYSQEKAKLFARDMGVTLDDSILKTQLDRHLDLVNALEKIKRDNILEVEANGSKDNTVGFSLTELYEDFPEFPWKHILGSYNLSSQFVVELNYTKGYYELWQNDQLNNDLKELYVSNFLALHLEELGAEYRDLYQDVFGYEKSVTTYCIRQTTKYAPRWADVFFSERVSKLHDYTEMEKLSANMKEAWLETMRENDWLEPETKQNITDTLTPLPIHFGYRIGLYSHEQLDELYSQFNLTDSPTFFDFVKTLPTKEIKEKFEGAFARDSTIPNAFNYAGKYVFMIAAIMEEPFYADDYPIELKYGGMGFVVAHEYTHTFDPNMLNRKLLVEDDSKQFDERVECIVDQFGNITYPLPSFHDVYRYDGRTTQGETTADNMGLRSAFRAYRKERARLYGDYSAKLPGLDEYDSDQLFFISFSQLWCEKSTERSRLAYFRDAHPLWKNRINEGVKNFESFSDAFSCKPESPMNPTKKCRIWRHRHRRQ